MNTKLTLSLQSEVIEKTKDYAKSHGISLSKLVEKYFESLIEAGSHRDITASLIGIASHPDRNLSYKELKAKYWEQAL